MKLKNLSTKRKPQSIIVDEKIPQEVIGARWISVQI